MTQEMTLKEFGKYITEKNVHSVCYDTDNDKSGHIGGVAVSLRFARLEVSAWSKRICLISDIGTMCFGGIENLQLEQNGFYDVLTISGKRHDAPYKHNLLIDY